MSRHPHADLMIAYANDDSLVIETSVDGKRWFVVEEPCWAKEQQYRIKPAPKKVYVFMYKSNVVGEWCHVTSNSSEDAEHIRSNVMRQNCEVTTIKEVVFE